VAGVLTAAPVGDGYTPAATLQDIRTSRGGSFAISGATVVYQLEYGRQGESFWTPEATLGPSTGSIESGTQGIRFRNAQPGIAATVSVYIAEGHEPFLSVVTGGGTVSGAGTPVVNVQSFGALGDGVTNDGPAIAAAFAAIPATGGSLYFPNGRYRFNAPLVFSSTFGRPVSIIGQAEFTTILAPAFPAGDAITFTGDGSTRFTASDFSINSIGPRNPGTYNLRVADCTRVNVHDISQDSVGGGLFRFDHDVFLQLEALQGDSTNGSTLGDTCLRIARCNAAAISDCIFRTGSGLVGYTNCKPCLWVTGTCTGLGFDNCTFAGAGPASQFAVASVTSSGVDFTVTTTAAHDFRPGDFVVLRGMTPAAYNSMFRVATVPSSTSLTVASTANPGPATVVGTAESVATPAYIANTDFGGGFASVNESRFASCIFEAIQPGLYGSAALYFDGRRSLNGAQAGSLSGWNLDASNYYDQYAMGLLVSGMASNAANETVANGFSVGGGVFNARGRAIHIDQVQAVTISGEVACVPGSVIPIDDGVSESAGLYIYAGPAAPFSQGIVVADSLFGMGRNWQTINNTPYKNGILLDSPGIDDLVVHGCHCFGTSAAIGEVNSPFLPLPTAKRWRVHDNILGSGTLPINNTTVIPSVASAATVSLTNLFHGVIRVTGGVNIQTINNYWFGRRLTLLFAAANTLLPGGNIAIAVNYPVVAGQLLELVFDGTAWYLN
jgi:hypothetical protein